MCLHFYQTWNMEIYLKFYSENFLQPCQQEKKALDPISRAPYIFYRKIFFMSTLCLNGRKKEKQWCDFRPCPKRQPVKVRKLTNFNSPPIWPLMQKTLYLSVIILIFLKTRLI